MIKKSRYTFAVHALILKSYHSHLELNVNSIPKEKKGKFKEDVKEFCFLLLSCSCQKKKEKE